MKAAIYARFSSDLQNERSIDDQIALCRAYAERQGMIIAQVYEDRAISGASTVTRHGWRTLMAHAADRRFDVIIAEDIDRISRDEADYHAARKRLAFIGIAIHTAHTGPISGIEGSVRAMMASYFLENLAHKVRRGQAGVIRSGRHAGGRAYGYRPVAGKRGELTIVAEEAEVVRRIFADYAAGHSPRDIAGALNREGIPPPRGTVWNASTINGSRQRGNGILGNELYRGKLVWNRVGMIKDPETGRRLSRPNPPSEWQIADVPHLAIVAAELAEAVDRQRQRRHRDRHMKARPKRLLSGLLRCACCGSGMSISDHDRSGRARIMCSRAKKSGNCDHRRRYYLDNIERTVLEGLRTELDNPKRLRDFVAAYQAERRRLTTGTDARRSKAEQRLGVVKRSLHRLVDAIASGMSSVDTVRDTILDLEREKNDLKAKLAAPADPTRVTLHPKALERHLLSLHRLAAAIRDQDSVGDGQPAALFHQLVGRVTVHPVPPRSPLDIEITGRLTELLSAPGLPPSGRFGVGGGGSGGGI